MTHSMNCTLSGIDMIGNIPWGSHFCNLYDSHEDLISILIPYIKTGLENNELVVANLTDDFDLEKMLIQLSPAIPEIEDYIKNKKIIIFKNKDFCCSASAATANDLLSDFIKLEQEAMKNHFTGMRIIGLVEPLTKKQWRDYMDFEDAINTLFAKHNIITLCCYRLKDCDANCVIDLVQKHGFFLLKRDENWEMLENSQIKILKAELHNKNLELEQKILERTQSLQVALNARDQFLLVASHELKTPIASLCLYLDGMLHNKRTAFDIPVEMLPYLTKMREQSRLLEMRINSLLDVTRNEKVNILGLELEDVNLSMLACDIISRYEYVGLIESSIQTDVMVLGDPFRLDQVISNLIDNAIKYSDNKLITITLTKNVECGVFEVKDQGIGILANDHERIFEKFTKIDSRQCVEGFGLGLWLVKEIVDAHRGEVRLDSDLGRGAKFIFKMPLHTEASPHLHSTSEISGNGSYAVSA